MKKSQLATVGKILKEEFMVPNHVSAHFLAKSINVPVSYIQDIISDRKAMTVDLSTRLGKFFGLSNSYFINIFNSINEMNFEIPEEIDLTNAIRSPYAKLLKEQKLNK